MLKFNVTNGIAEANENDEQDSGEEDSKKEEL
jgi:hypothetical protein